MRLDISLWVSLKGADLVASTAYLTLVDKMAYSGNLLGLKRLDAYRFSIETNAPEETARTLRRVLAGQSRFYNRNKHNYFLDCRWDGGELADDVQLEELDRRLRLEVSQRLTVGTPEDFNSQSTRDRVILKNIPVFRTDVLVEDLDTTAKEKLARHLESELSATVEVPVLGTCWYLAIAARSEDLARNTAEEIAVTQSRDRGLLLNPNHQGFGILSLQPMDVDPA